MKPTIELGVKVAQMGRQASPSRGFGIVAQDSPAVAIQQAHLETGLGIFVFGQRQPFGKGHFIFAVVKGQPPPRAACR